MKVKILLIFWAALFFSSCGDVKIKSKWADFDIRIDGNIEDWEGKLVHFKEEHAALGIANDSSFFYVALSTRERSIFIQALTGGLTLWFEAEGDSAKKIGVIFPIGEKTNITPYGNHQNAEKNIDKMIREIIESQDEISIVDEDSYPLALLNVKNEKNIAAAIGLSRNVFYYELKIPLTKSKTAPYAIGAKLPGSVLLEIESIQPERKEREYGMRGKGGGRVGLGGSMHNRETEQLEISLEVILAQESGSGKIN